MTMSTNMCWR